MRSVEGTMGLFFQTLLIIQLLWLTGVSAAAFAHQPVKPEQLDDGWPVSSLQAEGIAAEPVRKLIKDIKAGQYPGVNALLIARHGNLVSEQYFGGYRSKGLDRFVPYDRAILHQTRSSFKSVTGLLAGIALEKGLIKPDDLLLPLLQPYHALAKPDPRKKNITIRHLLDMRSGLDCAEMPGDRPERETERRNKTDMVRSHLQIPMAGRPGSRWRYCSSNPMLLGFALEAVLTDKGEGRLKAFLDRNLMLPLGISYYRTGYSPRGLMLMHGGQRMRVRDMAKFGQLVVSAGRWNGQQVVPAEWVRDLQQSGVETDWSWTRFISGEKIHQRTSRYRSKWFQTKLLVGGRDIQLVHSWGNGGQFVVAVPELDLVVATTGSNYGSARIQEQAAIFRMLHSHILPAVLNGLE